MSDIFDTTAAFIGDGLTFSRVATDLQHSAFPEVAVALRERINVILKKWRIHSRQAMPHLNRMTLAEFENEIANILMAFSEALESDVPEHLRGLFDESPKHGLERFALEVGLQDYFEEGRILRGLIVDEVSDAISRPLAVDEVATFHAIFDVMMQQGALALMQKQKQQLDKAEETLRDSQWFLRSSLDALAESIAVLDEKGIILDVNESWRIFAGENSFVGGSFGVGTSYLGPCDDAVGSDLSGNIIADGIRDVIAGRRVQFEAEYPCHSPNEQRWFLMRATKFHGPGPVRLIVSHDNITERKLAEEGNRELAVQLRLALAEQERLLVSERNARAVAESASRAKDRFLAALSHELRTPLVPVVMTVAALELSADLPPAVREDLKAIRRNVELEARLIDDLLDVSRIISGKLRLRLDVVDVNDLIRHVCEMCQSNVLEKGIRLHVELDSNTQAVTGDAARLQQVFWNLLTNAAKFTPHAGDIYVSTQMVGGDRVCITVRDTGVGIPGEILPRIFDVFEQGDSQVTKEFGGMGLGLAISKAMVEQHSGAIRAESAGINNGSTFVVELPAMAAILASRRVVVPVGSERDPVRLLRLLVVEDHADSARILRRLLNTSGHAVQTAATVATAMDLAREHVFDIVISDLGLPDGTGYELMQHLKEHYGLLGIAMSGFGMEEDLIKSKQAGFSEHLVKPVSISELERAIQRVSGSLSQTD